MDKVKITAGFDNFEGDTLQWKLSFYELWEYQMLWKYAYEIQVKEVNGVVVELIIKESQFDAVLTLMETLGYREIRAYRMSDNYLIGIYNV